MSNNGKSCNACTCGNNKHISIPSRGPFEALEALGARRTCVAAFGTMQIAVPQDWTIQPTSVSPFHHHLLDGEGHPLACLLTKPGSGGTGSFQISTEDNCAELASK